MLDEAPGSCAAGESMRPAGTGGGGGGVAIIVVVALLGIAGGVLYFVTRKPPEQKTVTTVETVSATTTSEPTIDLPAIDPTMIDSGVDAEEDSGVDAGKKVVAMGEACPAACAGQPTDALKQAVGARAGTAKQCYKTALEGNEGLAGDMSVIVRVGTNGATCAVSIASDTTGSSRLQQCVKAKMAASYPTPRGGCVDISVPISFKPKT